MSSFCDCKPLTLTDFELYDNFIPKGSTTVKLKEVSPYYVVPDCGTLTFSGKNKNTGCLPDYIPEWFVIDNVVHNPLGFAEITFHRISGLNCDNTNLGGTQYDHYDSEIVSVNDNHTDYGKNPWWDCELCAAIQTTCQTSVFGEPERCFNINTSLAPAGTTEGGVYKYWYTTDTLPSFYPPYDAPTGCKWIAHVTIYGALFSQFNIGLDFDTVARWYIAVNQNQGVLGSPSAGDLEQSKNFAPGDHADADLNMSGWYDNNGLGYTPSSGFTGNVRIQIDLGSASATGRTYTSCYIYNVAYHLVTI